MALKKSNKRDLRWGLQHPEPTATLRGSRSPSKVQTAVATALGPETCGFPWRSGLGALDAGLSPGLTAPLTPGRIWGRDSLAGISGTTITRSFQPGQRMGEGVPGPHPRHCWPIPAGPGPGHTPPSTLRHRGPGLQHRKATLTSSPRPGVAGEAARPRRASAPPSLSRVPLGRMSCRSRDPGATRGEGLTGTPGSPPRTAPQPRARPLPRPLCMSTCRPGNLSSSSSAAAFLRKEGSLPLNN